MKKSPLRRVLPLVIALCAMTGAVSAETEPQDVSGAVLQRDSLFWKAYNDCDLKGMGEFFTEDVEFYHDVGGVTLGVANLVGSVRDNLCSNPDSRFRRKAVDGTIRVFPLKKENTVYGAILSGEHLFYVLDKGKPERATGLARFTHLWLLKDGAWKMSRVLSYDHGPAPAVIKQSQ